MLYVPTERSKIHTPGSIEDLITNLIKNWEKELAHKPNPQHWRTMCPDNFRLSVNGNSWKSVPELAVLGPYNVFIGESEYYSASRVENSPASHVVFRTALKEGFAIEILKVYAPPPNVVFKWRHWGKMGGDLKCPMRGENFLELPANGAKVELIGISKVVLNDQWQIMEMEHFLRPEAMFEQMVAGRGKE